MKHTSTYGYINPIDSVRVNKYPNRQFWSRSYRRRESIRNTFSDSRTAIEARERLERLEKAKEELGSSE